MIKLRLKGLLYTAGIFWLIVGWRAFHAHGWKTFLPIIITYSVLPLLENMIPESTKNLSEEEENSIANDSFFDFLIYLMVPIQFFLLFLYLQRISSGDYTTSEFIGLSLTMGLFCGVLGINVAHELGHRNTSHEVIMAKLLLMTSLYMHFFIEHNKGHHRNVATWEDPATARKNESVYSFWFRSIYYSFVSAWNISKKELQRKKESVWGLTNPMIQLILIQIAFIVGINWFFGHMATAGFVLAAVVGFLHLETVNYIEHYGLMRNKITDKRYENVEAWHSWNSNKMIGRTLLFELTRHSDHHYRVHKKYQTLSHLSHAPVLPFGYPGAMLLSLFPPIWFRLVNPKIPNQ